MPPVILHVPEDHILPYMLHGHHIAGVISCLRPHRRRPCTGTWPERHALLSPADHVRVHRPAIFWFFHLSQITPFTVAMASLFDVPLRQVKIFAVAGGLV